MANSFIDTGFDEKAQEYADIIDRKYESGELTLSKASYRMAKLEEWVKVWNDLVMAEHDKYAKMMEDVQCGTFDEDEMRWEDET
ncbi:hypothetical protein D3C77_592160 [compost metagenome]